MGRTPVLVYTDDGRDVDDIEAITYLAGHPRDVDIVGIVTTHMIPDRRALIAREVAKNLGMPDVPIGVGSIHPVGKEDEHLLRYLREHTIENRTYEGEGLIECFPDGIDVMMETIERYGPELSIAVQAPLTDLAHAIERDRDHFCNLGRLYIQGQATIQGERLLPDPEAYNIKEDEEAARIVFEQQYKVDMTLVGKYASYQVPLTRADFTTLACTPNPVGTYLKAHAEKGLACFAERAPETFQRVFGIEATRVSELENLSNPYDAIVAKAIANPEGLSGTYHNNHYLIGMSEEEPGITDAEEVKSDLMGKMLYALLNGYASSPRCYRE